MIDLLNTLSVEQILFYLIMFVLAAKEIFTVVSWFKEKYNEKFNKDYSKKTEKESFEKLCKELQEQNMATQKMCKDLEVKLDDLSHAFSVRLGAMDDKINKITTSNMHDIKSWIVDKHHTLMKQKRIDDFTMDTLEKRYDDYVALGGNSYIGGLMNELRKKAHYPIDEE